MSEKVKVSKEVAEAIEEAKRKGIGCEGEAKMVRLHVTGPGGWLDHCEPLNSLDLDTLIRALYIGYEVEQTPEDKVRELYIDQKCKPTGDTMVTHLAIKDVLNILNIKIEGVNA